MELVVLDVVRGSIAERLGIARDDRLLSYDGARLTAVRQFITLVGDETRPAARSLTIRRRSQVYTIAVPPGRLGVNIGIARADPPTATGATDDATPAK